MSRMIPSLSSNVLLVSFPGRNHAYSNHFSLRVEFSPISQTKLFSSQDDSFTVSNYLQLKDSSNPESALIFLRKHGFSDARIKKLIKGYPNVLLLDSEKNLKPKMEFFRSIGVKGEDFAAILCRNPMLLGCSLDKQIIPCYGFLKRVLVHDELVVRSLRNGTYGCKASLEKIIIPNFELLRKVGVPESKLQFVLTQFFGLLALDHAEFSRRVDRVFSMGFDPSKNSFLEAIRCWPTKGNWERKSKVFKTWGWSDSDVWSAFRKNPNFMNVSAERLTAVMDILVNKMGWDPLAVAGFSNVLSYSLEKHIIPKCSVIRVLMLKGLIPYEFALASFLPYDKNTFLDKFVFKFREQVPELLDICKGEVDTSELGYGFEDKLVTKLD